MQIRNLEQLLLFTALKNIHWSQSLKLRIYIFMNKQNVYKQTHFFITVSFENLKVTIF